MCEIFLRNKCTGCVGLDPQYDIDRIKYKCELYREEMKVEKGEQMKWN